MTTLGLQAPLHRPQARARRVARSLLLAALAWIKGADLACGQNLLANPGFETGISPWYAFGPATVAATETRARSGSGAALITERTASWHGVAVDLSTLVSPGQYVTISGWALHDSAVEDELRLMVRQIDSFDTQYHLVAGKRVPGLTWTPLSGDFTLFVRGTLKELTLYFEGPVSGVALQADDAAVTPAGDWRAAANVRIEAIRKRDARIRVHDCCGAPAAARVPVQVRQVRHTFAFGSALNTSLLSNPTYAEFFRTHYEWAVLENESKWWNNEPLQGRTDYQEADKLLEFCRVNDIQARGHSLFWDVQDWVQPWVQALNNADLQLALENRLVSATSHFAGRFRHWDVNNEILHGGYYGARLGAGIYPWMFKRARELDPAALLMVNDHYVIEQNDTDKYIEQIRELQAQGAPVDAIGAEGHFYGVDPLDVYSRFERLATTGLRIWVTEYDSVQADEALRADDLEALYRTAFSHPAVDGVFQWGFWAGSMWRGEDAALANRDWSLNEAGRRYESLLAEWTTSFDAETDADGQLAFRGFHGRYEVIVTPPHGKPVLSILELSPGSDPVVLDVTTDCQTDPRVWLLRNDEITSLEPPQPAIATVFNQCAADSLELSGQDRTADAGEGLRLASAGSEDDDDAYVQGFPPGGLEPEPLVLTDVNRPLVFYQVTYPGVLWLAKSPGGFRLTY